ncbi:transmembrane protein 117-like isoform 2-T2 [Salvelinus alpinus]
MEVEAPDGPLDTGILTGQFGTAQLEDPNLQNTRGQVIAVDGALLPGYVRTVLQLAPTPTCSGHTWGCRKPGSGSGIGSTVPESRVPLRTTAVPAWSARSQLTWPHMVTEYMGIRNESFMKIAAVGTWMGDFVTAWMVTDMMLQDQHYPDWGKAARRFWKQGNHRIILFWTVLITLTSVVLLVISTDWISWDNLNRGFLPSDEVSRAFLVSFILVFDLLIVMQDWDFPQFMGDLDMNLPGMSTTQLKFKLPVCKSIFKEEYHIHITGKWFNYGIIFLVLILDLNMWKNQIFYKPYEYGQYVGPGEKIFTVEEPHTLGDFNRSTLTYKWRSSHVDPLTNRSYVHRDMFLHSRYVGASLEVKCLAFIPSLAAFVLFGFFIWLLGRFQDSETFPEGQVDKTYERIKRKSPSEYSKDMGLTPEEVHISMSEALKRSGTPMLLSVDGHHFALHSATSTNSTSPVSMESQETHPSIVIKGAEPREPAVSFDVGKLSPP